MTSVSRDVHSGTATVWKDLPSLRVDPGQEPATREGDARPDEAVASGHNAAPHERTRRADPSTVRHLAKPSELVSELSLVVVCLVGALSVCRLVRGGFGDGVVVPVFTTVVCSALSAGLAARRRWRFPAFVALGLVVMALVAVWTVTPGATWAGVPTIHGFHVILHEINQARSVMGSYKTPVPRTTGVVLIASLAAGVVSVISRTFFEVARRSGRRVSTLLALIPSFGMLLYSSPLSARIDRPEIAIGYASAAMFFAFVAESSGSASGASSSSPLGLTRMKAAAASILPALATAGIAILVVLTAAAALAGTVPLAFPWWNAPNGPGNGGPGTGTTALSIIDNLRATELNERNVAMFEASSDIATYWQVGLLDVYKDGSWRPSGAELAAIDGNTTPRHLPHVELPGSTTTHIASFQIQDYTGRLVPAPPYAELPVVYSQNENMTFDDAIGVYRSTPLKPDSTYEVIFRQLPIPAVDSGPSSLGEIYLGLGSARSTYLSLPSGIPAEVATFAREVVAGATSPMQEVQDLVNYFRTGFVYTLDPPPTPAHENPLVAFLTDRVGYCQQFAGTFAVMARELGIPVRLAVGFTPGQAMGGGRYEVTGADAHVWPEVYMGPQYGWISVDPTPSSAAGTQPSPTMLTYRPVGKSSGSRSGSRDCITNVHAITVCKGNKPKPTGPTTVPTTTPARPAKSGATGRTARKPAPLPAGLILAVVVAFFLLIGGAFVYRRSRRSVRQRISRAGRPTDPDLVVLEAWSRASQALGRTGFHRAVWTTPVAHARWVADVVNDGIPGTGRSKARRDDASAALGAATYGYAELAHLAELACYCPGRCTDRDARHAEQEAWRIERALRVSGLSRRLPAPPQQRITAKAPAGTRRH